VYIIAELSANHNQDLDIALKSIKTAKEIGANAIKLQTYQADSMTINCDRDDFIIKGGLWDNRTLYSLYEEASTPLSWHKILFSYAKEIGIDIFSSPFDKESVDFLEKLNPIAYKIASFEIVDYELVRYVASKKRPIILSLGIASLEEIHHVIDICKSEDNDQLVLLKCTSSYPAPNNQANLRTIQDIENRFNFFSGLSDHSLGHTASIVATSLGAKIIEKHFILDKSLDSLDSAFSLDKYEFRDMIQAIRDSEELLGKIDYSVNEKNRTFARSIYIIKDIKKGEIFTRDNLKVIRPAYGKHPKFLKDYLGKMSEIDYKMGDRLK